MAISQSLRQLGTFDLLETDILREDARHCARPMKQPTRPKQFGRAFFVSAADGRDVRLLDVRLGRRLTER